MDAGTHAVFFDDEDAGRAAHSLRRRGYAAGVRRGRLAGEDDDEDQPWVLVTDAPAGVLQPLVEEHDGWLEAEAPSVVPAPLPLPGAPIRRHRDLPRET